MNTSKEDLCHFCTAFLTMKLHIHVHQSRLISYNCGLLSVFLLKHLMMSNHADLLSVFWHLLLPHWEENSKTFFLFIDSPPPPLTAQHTLVFTVLSSLALVFFSNPSCPDKPWCHKAAYITSLSGAARVVPSHIQNIQSELFDLQLFWTLSKQKMKIYGAPWVMSKQRLPCLLCLKFDWNTAMTDDWF